MSTVQRTRNGDNSVMNGHGHRSRRRIPSIRALIAGLLLLTATLPPTNAQEFPFESYTTTNGLPSNWVNAITQDSRGYIWGGGEGGVFRYNGVEFTSFGPTDGMPVPLAWSIIESRTSPGTMLVGTHLGGLCKIVDGRITYISLGNDQRKNVVPRVLEDRKGIVWCGTSWGVVRVRDDSVLASISLIDTGQVNILHETASGTILIAIGRGLYAYNNTSGTLAHSPIESADHEYTSIVEEKNGTLWLGTSGGVIVKVVDNRIIARLTTTTGVLHSGTVDSSGILWFCSSSGMVRVPAAGFPAVEIALFAENLPLGDRNPSSVFIDREDILWVAGRSTGITRLAHRNITRFSFPSLLPDLLNGTVAVHASGRLFVATSGFLWELWKEKSGIWTKYGHRLEAPQTNVAPDGGAYSTVLLGDTRLCVGFPGGGLRSFRLQIQQQGPSRLSAERTVSPMSRLPTGILVGLTLTRKGTLLYNVRGGPLHQLDPITFAVLEKYTVGGELVNSGTAQAMLEEEDGTLWFGTFAGGISKFAYDNGRYHPLGMLTQKDGLTSNRIRSLMKRNNGDIWIGTRFDGISILKNTRFDTLNTRNALPANAIWKIAEDETGRIWLGTSMGLSSIDPTSYRISTYPALTGKQVGGIGNIPGKKTLWCVAGGELILYEYGDVSGTLQSSVSTRRPVRFSCKQHISLPVDRAGAHI
jgi:ligand-binding sensor domain-containing protein